jgi:hypothetical protein
MIFKERGMCDHCQTTGWNQVECRYPFPRTILYAVLTKMVAKAIP